MSNSDLATLLVLLSAVMHASWNAVVKSSSDRLATMALVDVTAGALALALLPLVEPPPLHIWGYIGLSMVLNLIYRWMLIRAYEFGDFGQVYPVVRGLPPLLVAIIATLWLGEVLSGYATLGVAMISLGILSLLHASSMSRQQLQAIAYAAAAGVCVALYTVVDAQGVRGAESVLQFVVYFTLVLSLPIPLVAYWRRGPVLLQFAQANWRLGLFGGLNYSLAYALVLWALTLDSVAKTAALRESSVIIAAIIATLLFKEPFGIRRAVVAVAVTVGIMLIKWGH